MLTGVMVFGLATFLFVMALIMLDELYINTADSTGTTNNETLDSVSGDTVQYVDNSNACGFHGFAVTEVYNNTAAVLIDSGNYTINARLGTIKFSGDDQTYNGTEWNVTYTYFYGAGEACQASNETYVGYGKFGDYIDLIVLAIIITVVLSLVIGVIAMNKVR